MYGPLSLPPQTTELSVVGPGGIDQGAFHRLVSVQIAGNMYQGWVSG